MPYEFTFSLHFSRAVFTMYCSLLAILLSYCTSLRMDIVCLCLIQHSEGRLCLLLSVKGIQG